MTIQPLTYVVRKDKAAKFVDMLSAIGCTMGLLTGFSIIGAVAWSLVPGEVENFHSTDDRESYEKSHGASNC